MVHVKYTFDQTTDKIQSLLEELGIGFVYIDKGGIIQAPHYEQLRDEYDALISQGKQREAEEHDFALYDEIDSLARAMDWSDVQDSKLVIINQDPTAL